MSQKPRSFRPYQTSDEETTPDSETRRISSTDRGDTWQEMVNPDWRERRRRTTAPTRSTAKVPSKQLSLWVQRGGWKILAGAAAVLLVLMFIILVSQGDDPVVEPPTSVATDPNFNNTGVLTDGGEIVQLDPDGQPIVPGAQPTDPAAQPAGSRFAVSNTGSEGLFLRDQPGGTVLKTLPEGTVVEKLGEQQAPDRMWFNVLDTTSGLTGWVAADFLQPAP